MNDVLVTYLARIRDACDEALHRMPGEQTAGLGYACTLLGTMIAQETVLPSLRRAAQLALSPTNDSGDFLSTAAQRVRTLPTLESAQAREECRRILRIDQEVLEAFDREARGQAHGRNGSPPTQVLDSEALLRFISRAVPAEKTLELLGWRVASQGFSKQTLLVGLRGTTSIPEEIVIRMDRPAGFLTTTVRDEFGVLEELYRAGVRVPRPIAIEPSGAVLGAPFIVVAKAEGATAGNNYRFPPPSDALLCDIASCLAAIHSVAANRTTLKLAPMDGRWHIDGEIDKYWHDWTALGENCPTLELAFKWIDEHRRFAYGPTALVHNDFNFNNLLIRDDRVSAILDWEFAHIGNPAADLGYFYYAAESIGSFERFLGAYRDAGGRVPERSTIDFYVLWGQMRLAVMCFQAERAFRDGRLDDIRFALTGALYVRIVLRRIGAGLLEFLSRH